MAEMMRIGARGLEHPFEGEIAEGIGAQVALDLVRFVAGADQLFPRGRVDSVVARPLDGRRGDAYVHLAGPSRADHLDDLAARRAAHDGVVHDDNALALQDLSIRVELDL